MITIKCATCGEDCPKQDGRPVMYCSSTCVAAMRRRQYKKRGGFAARPADNEMPESAWRASKVECRTCCGSKICPVHKRMWNERVVPYSRRTSHLRSIRAPLQPI